MTQSKKATYKQIEEVMSHAAPEKIQQLLNDIAMGQLAGTAQTRAGNNDNQTNVISLKAHALTREQRSVQEARDACDRSRKLRDALHPQYTKKDMDLSA